MKVPISRDDRVDHPVWPHAATKRSIELVAEAHAKRFGIRATMPRFFAVTRQGGVARHGAGGPCRGETIRDFSHYDMTPKGRQVVWVAGPRGT